jgi:hypothetical protein
VVMAINDDEEDTDDDIIVSEVNGNDNDEEDMDEAAPFCFIAPSNSKKVKTKPGKWSYWANEVTVTVSWVRPLPNVVYHKPLPKRSTITYYSFAKPPTHARK